jgi:hypothetical protein
VCEQRGSSAADRSIGDQVRRHFVFNGRVKKGPTPMALELATPNLLRPSQVASRLELSVSRIRQLAEAGQLLCIDTPYGRLFSEDVVQAFAHKREQSGPQVVEAVV